MILSFHPCIETDGNITCAGRDPNREDLEAIKAADAVILPQGCGRLLYEMAHKNCAHVFPNYDARFAYTGKIGQTMLFRKTGVRHPKTKTFLNIKAYTGRHGEIFENRGFDYPFVFKFSWGGEGDSVYLIQSENDLKHVMKKAAEYERGGLNGFLLQEYIPTKGRVLRVVVIGQTIVSYWRIQRGEEHFYSGLAAGADIDPDFNPVHQDAAVRAVKAFCVITGINLAGFDLIFSTGAVTHKDRQEPFFLEINYFFGRQGLGGSEKFYALLQSEVEKWIAGLGLSAVKQNHGILN